MKNDKPNILNVAIAAPSPLTEADRNALDDWLAGIRRKGFTPTVVTHAKDPNLEDLRKFCEVNSVRFRYFEKPTPRGSALDKTRAPSAARMVAVTVAHCVKLSGGSAISDECQEAELPIWTFKTKP